MSDFVVPYILAVCGYFVIVWVANRVIEHHSNEMMDAYHDHALTLDGKR